MRDRVRRWLDGLRIAGRPDEHESKRLLAAAGIAVPEGVRLEGGAGADGVGFRGPYAVKACHPDVAHKTDVGAVRLEVRPDALPAALADVHGAFPDALVLVEPMVRGTGVELIVGGVDDPLFGPAVMVGAGGLLAEIVGDVAYRLAPCSEREALRMIDELAIAPLFRGHRGASLDAAGLARVVHTIGELALALGDDFSELDVNPLVQAGGGWTALDALIRLRART